MAIDSVLPNDLREIFSFISCIFLVKFCLVDSTSKYPGLIQLKRCPNGPNSKASDLVNPSIANFDVEYAICPEQPKADIELIFIRLHFNPNSLHILRYCLLIVKVEPRFKSNT